MVTEDTFKIQRLTMDSSWHISWKNVSFIVDPWLIGSEIDGGKWLNEQWHTTEPVPISELPKSNFILITQSYQDHCHIETLKQLDAKFPIIATEKAYKLLKKHFPERELILIDELNNEKSVTFGPLSISCIKPNRKLDPIYYSVIINDSDHNSVFLAPHGFELEACELDLLKNQSVQLLISTFVEFQLPGIMGGKVNPGLENAKTLAKQLSPKYILNTHDEDKKMKGIVAKLAKVKRPDFSSIKKEGFNFIETPDYTPLDLDF